MFKLCGLEKGRGVKVVDVCDDVREAALLEVDGCLAAEAVESAALALERVDDVHGGDRLALGMLGVGDRVADHVLQEDLEHSSRLLVDETAEALDAAATSQASNGRLGDALDVVAEHFSVTLGATLAQTFTSFASS